MQNGIQDIRPDTGYDGLTHVALNVQVPSTSPNLQSKIIVSEENGNETYYPDTGYDGFSEVTVITNIVIPELVTNDYTINSNGTYSVASLINDNFYDGMDGSSNIIVNVPQNYNKINLTGIKYSNMGYGKTFNGEFNEYSNSQVVVYPSTDTNMDHVTGVCFVGTPSNAWPWYQFIYICNSSNESNLTLSSSVLSQVGFDNSLADKVYYTRFHNTTPHVIRIDSSIGNIITSFQYINLGNYVSKGNVRFYKTDFHKDTVNIDFGNN